MAWAQFNKNTVTRMRQPWFGGGLGAVFATIVGLSLLYLPIGKGLRDWSYDLPFAVRKGIPVDNIVLIYLDEKSYGDLKQDPADFDRSLHAQLIRKLKIQGAKMIVLDIVFLDSKRTSTNADNDLAQAMREHGKVVLGGRYDFNDLIIRTGKIRPPVGSLREACAGWGLAEADRETDFEPRMHWVGTDQTSSLGWASAKIFDSSITAKENPAEEHWLNYPSSQPFEAMSYSDVIADGPMPNGISFKDKIVFVGSGDVAGYGGDQREQFRSPWTWCTDKYYFGVQVHAVTFWNLVQHNSLWRMHWILETLIIVIIGIALGYGLSLFKPLAASGLACIFALAVAVVNFSAFSCFHFWFPWLIPVAAQMPVALGWAYLFQSFNSYMELKFLETSLGLYLSPRQVKRILKQPELLKPGGKLQTVSILFSDIASFSKISERMPPEDLTKLLNDYYEAAIECVHKTDGTVMKLIGDAIFALWNAPEEQPDHHERACKAALLLSEKLINFDASGAHRPLRTRIGLHAGTACVGNIGSSTRFDYTAIGENVNTASRLEGLNKQMGTHILATREIQKSVEKQVASRWVGDFIFKGFDGPVAVYELISILKPGESPPPWLQTFEKGLLNFQRKKFNEAGEFFNQTLSLQPNDGPSKFYLGKIAEFQNRTLSEEWMGEIDLHEK